MKTKKWTVLWCVFLFKGPTLYNIIHTQNTGKVNFALNVSYQGDPEDYVLINEAVEVLVEEEEAGAYEGCVSEVQLTLGHVCHLKTQDGENID